MRCARVACLSWDTRLVAGIPVCATHGRELVAEVSTVEVARAEEWAKRLPTREPIGSVVLYVQIGGNVHIGWSVDPAGHLAALAARHGRVRLAAAEPGAAPEYRAACAAVKGCSLGGDLYAGGDDVKALLNTVRKAWPSWRDMVNEAAWHRARRRTWVDVAGAYAVSLSEEAPKPLREGRVRRSTVDGGCAHGPDSACLVCGL